MLFEPNIFDQCILCGSPEELTGEHKLKVSVIRSIFLREPLLIGTFNGVDKARLAQGPKSKALHFQARICAQCNSSRTQAADVEFTRFDETARARLAAGFDPATVFNEPRYVEGSEPYLNVFRYFAKMLACQIAEAGGPRALAVTDFAIGQSDFNPVRLAMEDDPVYRVWLAETGRTEFASHGGLGVSLSCKTELMTGFSSTLTHGALRYSFSVGFGWLVGQSLRDLHPVFHERCSSAYRETLTEAAQKVS